HHGRNHVVAIAKLGHQRVHDGVECLRRVAIYRYAFSAGSIDELSNRVERRFELRGHRLRCVGLATVYVLITRREVLIQLHQLPWWLRARRIVRDDPAPLRKEEMRPYRLDIEWRHPDVAGLRQTDQVAPFGRILGHVDSNHRTSPLNGSICARSLLSTP